MHVKMPRMADDAKVTKVTETHTTTTRVSGATPPALPIAPAVKTLDAKAITGSSANLNGEVIPNKAATQYWFEYGTTPNMGHSSAPQSAGDGDVLVPVAVALTGLAPSTTYFYRVVAENVNGKTAGAQHSFESTHAAANSSMLSNILAIVGFIILIAIIIWGLIHVAILASPSLSSLFNKKTPEALVVTAPSQATSGEAFTVSWKYTPPAAGSYAFLYQCKGDLQFETPGAGGAMNIVPCGAAFTVGASGDTLSVTPLLSGTSSVSVPLSILFLPGTAGGQQVQGNATIAVNPGAVQPTPAPVQTPAQPVTPVAPQPVHVSSPADLSVQILSVNTVSGTSVVSFDIANIGGTSSGTYYFEAFLPTQSQYVYTSPPQVSLAPGSHIISTLRFTQTIGGIFSILVDPSNMVPEANKTNNYASQTIQAPYYQQNQYQPYQQQYQYTY